MKIQLTAALLASVTLSSPVLAQTDVQWWHAMGG